MTLALGLMAAGRCHSSPLAQPVAPFVPTLPAPAPASTDTPAAGEPLSLSRALRLALEHNPGILQTQLAIHQAEAQLHLAEVGWYPSAGVSINSDEAGVGLPGTLQTNTGNLNVSQTVTDFGRTRAALRAARASLLSARANLLTHQEDVALQVQQQYFGTLANEQLALIAEESVRDQSAHLAQTEAFYQAGTKARIDVAQAQSSLATAQLALVSADNTRDQSYVALNNAMGFRSVAAYQLQDALIEQVAQNGMPDVPPAPQAAALVDDAYRARPDMLAIEAQLEAAQATLDLARLGLNPTLSGTGSLSLFTGTGQANRSWNLGMVLNIPILDSTATRYTVELDQAVVNTVQAQKTALQNTIYQQVQQDVLAMRQATASVQVSHRAVEAAQQAYDLANERYKVGLGSSLDYLDAQLAYVQSRSTLVTAEAGVRTAEAQLNHDVGRTDFLQATAAAKGD